MPSLLRPLLVACLVAGTVGTAFAQRTIFTCVDAKGRRLTSDRPLAECADREQKEYNGNGTVRRTIAPTPTAVERAALEEQQNKETAERQRQAEEKRLQKLLVARYPNQAVHDTERARSLQTVEEAIASGKRRITELQEQRKKLQAETEFYKTADKWPPQLKRQMEDNDQQTAAQQRFIATQDDEKKRISARYDEELARLKVLWAQNAASTGTAAAQAQTPSAPIRR